MEMINRIAVVVQPKQPLIDWLNQTPELASEPPFTLEDVRMENDVLLVPDADDLEKVIRFLRPRKLALFEMQLESWCTDPDLWPQNPTTKMFDEWFDLMIHDPVWDLVDRPIEYEAY